MSPNIPSCVAETMSRKFSMYAAKLASLRKRGTSYTDTVIRRRPMYSVRKKNSLFSNVLRVRATASSYAFWDLLVPTENEAVASRGGSFFEESYMFLPLFSPLLGGNKAFMAEPSDRPAINNGMDERKN